jgi:hypothetical protein
MKHKALYLTLWLLGVSACNLYFLLSAAALTAALSYKNIVM